LEEKWEFIPVISQCAKTICFTLEGINSFATTFFFKPRNLAKSVTVE